MKTFCCLACLLCLVAHAQAQPGADPTAPDDGPAQREQRRVELRHTLKTQRQGAGSTEAKRQLSAEEREELRQQLRQQQQGAGQSRP